MWGHPVSGECLSGASLSYPCLGRSGLLLVSEAQLYSVLADSRRNKSYVTLGLGRTKENAAQFDDGGGVFPAREGAFPMSANDNAHPNFSKA